MAMSHLDWFAYFDDNKRKFEWFCKPYLLNWSMVVYWRSKKNRHEMYLEMELILAKLEEAKFSTESKGYKEFETLVIG